VTDLYYHRPILTEAVQIPNERPESPLDPVLKFLGTELVDIYASESWGDYQVLFMSGHDLTMAFPSQWLVREADGRIIKLDDGAFENLYRPMSEMLENEGTSTTSDLEVARDIIKRLQDQVAYLTSAMDPMAGTILELADRVEKKSSPTTAVSVTEKPTGVNVTVSEGCGSNCICRRNR